ncbi:MAG: hypothetical protein KIS67_04855 [Verrucomicrobiae bacterium]|nr:hypothetical protein [Verrucomicrobiae bacterium]
MKQLMLSFIVLANTLVLLPAAEPKVLFHESFDGRMDKGWSWLREDGRTWRFKDDALEIRAEPGFAHNVKNALLRPAPDRNQRKIAIEITVTFTTPPTNQYEQAGLTWYQQGKPVFKLVHELVDGATYVFPGKVPTNTRTVQLQLVLSSGKYEARFRPDGKGEFQTAATGELPPGTDEQISLQCYHGPPESEHWMRFDDFRILELSE